MIRYSSSVHKSDLECSSKSVRGSLFVNPLYIKNLTNLTNLTTLQTLQPYRFLCRVPKGPHAYLCTLHKGRPPAPCSAHNLCSLSENRGSRGAAGSPFRTRFAAFRRGCNSAGFAHARTHGQRFGMEGPPAGSRAHAWVQLFISASRVPIKLGGPILEAKFPLACTVRGQSEVMEWKPCEPSKIKRTHRSRSFWLPRRRSVVFSCLLQAADDVPEMQHRCRDGLNGIVVQ